MPVVQHGEAINCFPHYSLYSLDGCWEIAYMIGGTITRVIGVTSTQVFDVD